MCSCILSQLQNCPKNRQDLLHCFPVRAKASGFKAEQSSRALWLYRGINTHQSADPKTYIQQISHPMLSCLHTCFKKTKYFFLILSCNILSLLGKYNLISLRVQGWLISHPIRGSFRLQRFLNNPPSTTSNIFFFKKSIKTQ